MHLLLIHKREEIGQFPGKGFPKMKILLQIVKGSQAVQNRSHYFAGNLFTVFKVLPLR
jgi:hypothetical protein